MLERFETSAEKAFFLSLCATVVLGVVVAVASVRTQIGVASPGFVVWQNLIVPAIGAIGPSPEAAAVPSYHLPFHQFRDQCVRAPCWCWNDPDTKANLARYRAGAVEDVARCSSCSDSRDHASHGSQCEWRRSSR